MPPKKWTDNIPVKGGIEMSRKYYSEEFREQMVSLVGAGRSPAELSREFEPTAQTILNWVAASERGSGSARRVAERDRKELRLLKRAYRRVKEERDILAKATAWFAREAKAVSKQPAGS